MAAGKRYTKAAGVAGAERWDDLPAAVSALKKTAAAKFDESVEVATRLGVDPRHPEQQIRGTVVLPHGTGKKVRILVLTKGEKVKEAEEAGADFAGADEYLQKIRDGWLDVDKIVATPDMMGEVGKLGKVLGPRGLMPNPKSGTVTFDIAKAVKDLKAGKIEYRVDKGGNVHCPFGKASFTEAQLTDNLRTFLAEIVRARPASAKGQFVKSITLSTTMGPAIRLNPATVLAATH